MLKKLLLAIPLGLSLNATADLDRYAGASLGLVETDHFEKSGIYFKAYGGTKVTDFMNLEFAFHYFGAFEDSKKSTIDASPTGVSFALAPFYEVYPGAQIFIKVGAMAWWAELSDKNSSSTQNIDSIDTLYGAGIRYQITPEISVTAELEEFELSQKLLPKTAVDTYMLSASYHF